MKYFPYIILFWLASIEARYWFHVRLLNRLCKLVYTISIEVFNREVNSFFVANQKEEKEEKETKH